MSFRQLFDRISELTGLAGSDGDVDLIRARMLIAEAGRGDSMPDEMLAAHINAAHKRIQAPPQDHSLLGNARRLLEVQADATWEVVTLSYRSKIRTSHPDHHPAASMEDAALAHLRTQELNAAYDLLRKHYFVAAHA